ncbi:MAG: hypothetical protein QME52_05905 [Bacteroidota bacterium]|nr:hypothetical protein [Bacteroidota bacterium]
MSPCKFILKLTIILLATIIAGSSLLFGQQKGYNDVVVLKNGSKIYGKIIEQSAEGLIRLETQSGSVFTFGPDEIQQISRNSNLPVANTNVIVTDSSASEYTDSISRSTQVQKKEGDMSGKNIEQFKPVPRSPLSRSAYPEYLPPLDESPIITELGIGLGLPYGFLGGRISLGTDIISGELGLGLVPISWDGSFSIGGTIHLLNRYDNVRPKITILWSNTAGYNLIYGQTSSYSSSISSLKVLYKEAFPGFGFFGGLDIKFGKTSNMFIDLNIGAISTTIGLEEQKKRFAEEVKELESRGWSLDSKATPTYFPKISIGFGYVIGRSLEYRY